MAQHAYQVGTPSILSPTLFNDDRTRLIYYPTEKYSSNHTLKAMSLVELKRCNEILIAVSAH